MVEEDVPGHNNCLFKALVLQLGRLELFSGDAESLRRETVEWMRSHADQWIDHEQGAGRRTCLRDFVHGSWETYLKEMAKHGGRWGDHCDLVATGETRLRAHSVTLPSSCR